jgi:hypothetical protein
LEGTPFLKRNRQALVCAAVALNHFLHEGKVVNARTETAGPNPASSFM